MDRTLTKLLTKFLREVAQKIDAGTSEISEEQALNIMGILSHEPISKEQACVYLNLSRSRFDDLVRDGVIPKGRKRRGWKELAWYKDELKECIKPLTT